MTTYKAKDLDLQKLGLNDNLVISRNLCYQDLVLDIVNNGEGHIASSGAAMIDSGKYTGRSPKDKYIVDETSSTNKIWWGEVNQKISENIFCRLSILCILRFVSSIYKDLLISIWIVSMPTNGLP